MTNDEIRNIALEHEFTLRRQPDGGPLDLNGYVYDFARAIIAAQKEVDAALCERIALGLEPIETHGEGVTGFDYADAIRATQQKEGI